VMKRCVHQQRRGKIMRLVAFNVNFFFLLQRLFSGGPKVVNYLISLTVSSGRRTIAKARRACKVFTEFK